MISKKMEKALNKQINAETYSAYLYWSMSAALEAMNLRGCAFWMRAQAQEEMMHAMKFFDYVYERGGRVTLTAIDGPPTEWKDITAVFRNVLAHEKHVTGLINGLADLAVQEKDHAAGIFLQWFVSEQVEEEAGAVDILSKLDLIGHSAGGLYMLDRELGQRVFTPPATGKQS